MAHLVLNYAKHALLTGSINLQDVTGANSIYCALINSSAVTDLNVDTHRFFGDVIGTFSCSGAGYGTAGLVLSSPLVSVDTTNNYGALTASNMLWPNVTVTARGAILYQSTGSGLDADPMICFIDFGADKSVTAGSFTIQWAAAGVLYLT
jgi:hypothetical protein